MSDNTSLMLGLRTTIYKVGDMNEAKHWYAQAFGVQPYFDEPFYIGFNVGGYELGLQPSDKPNNKSIDNVMSYWGVEHIQDTYERLIALGATEHESPSEVGGGIMVASVFDPWNNVVGLIFNPHFKL